jgi:Ni/Co efflux regulator RcnB
MKRLLTATLALSLLAGTAASAQPYDQRQNDGRDNNGRYEQNRQDGHTDNNGRYDQNRHDNRGDQGDRGNHYGQNHRWARGERLPSSYYSDRGHYVDYRRHHLRQPPRGY